MVGEYRVSTDEYHTQRYLQLLLSQQYGFGPREVEWIMGKPLMPVQIWESSEKDLLQTFWLRAFGRLYKEGSEKQRIDYSFAYPFIVKEVVQSIKLPDILNQKDFHYTGPNFRLPRHIIQKSALDVFFFFKSLFRVWWKYPGFIPRQLKFKRVEEETNERLEELRQQCLNHSALFDILGELK